MRLFDRETGASVSQPRTVPLRDRQGKNVLEPLSLTDLANGRYRLEVTLEDPAGSPLASSTADFDVSPRTSIPRPWSLRWPGLDVSVPGVVETSLAEQYLRLERPAEARVLYERAFEKNPSLTVPRLALARYRLDEKNPAKAAELLEPMIEGQSENSELRRTLGDAYLGNGDPERALPHFEKALELSGPEPGILNALGACHAALGNKDKAIAYLEQSLQAEPDQENVRSLVEQLKPGPP
jgi:tetratricopeptide (TPR) repeat protein